MKTIHQLLDEIILLLAATEQRKNAAIRKYTIRLFLLILSFPASIILLNIFDIPPILIIPEFAVIGLLIFGIIKISIFRSNASDVYRSEFKSIVMPAVFKALGLDVEYRKDYFIPLEEFSKCEIFPYQQTNYTGEDYIKTLSGKTQIEFCDLTVERSGGKNRNVIAFKGWFLIADFNKRFKGKTFLIPETAGMQSGIIAQSIMKLNPGGYRLAKLEDPEFEKRFAVYTTDQIEARYILSFTLMKQLTQLTEQFVRDIRIAFLDSRIYIGIMNYENLFDPAFRRNASIKSDLARVITQLRDCLNIVDTLHLNTRLWTKE